MKPLQALEKMTILVAEDDSVIRHLIRAILEKAGYQLLIAANGRHALEISSAHDGPIHLLLSDVMMPEMNGPDLAEQLQDTRPSTRVVFMSAYVDGALNLDRACSFIQKPFQPNELVETICGALAGERANVRLRNGTLSAQNPWCGSPSPALG